MKDHNERLSPEDPVSSQVFIDKILSRYGRDITSQTDNLGACWSVIAGSMASLCSFVSLDNGVLTVRCNHPAKANAVKMNRNELIKSIKSVMPELEINKLSVRLYG